jgi:hypothetical protein
MVINTHVMVADIHRNLLMEQEGVSNLRYTVCATYYLARKSADHPVDSRQVSDDEYNGAHGLMFS